MQKETPVQGSRESHRMLPFCASPEPVKNNNNFTSKNVMVSRYYKWKTMFLLGSLEAESLDVKKKSRNSDIIQITEVNPKVIVK